MPQSCADCVHYRDEEDGAALWKKSLGAPACAKLEKLLAKPGMQPSVMQSLAVAFADGCDEYVDAGSGDGFGEVTRPQWRRDSFTVTAPDPAVILAGESDPDDRARSCNGCEHFVDPRAVKAELRWPFGVCAASGRGILANRYTQEAGMCAFSKRGTPRDTTANLHEAPQYREGFATLHVGQGSGQVPGTRPGEWVEPTAYPTDRELTDGEKSFKNDAGVPWLLAVRRFYNPSGTGQYVEAYVWNPEAFDADERARIPQTGDDTHPEWYIDHDGLVYRMMVAWLGVDLTPLLWGHAGVGKTELLRHVAWMLQLPFERVSIRADTQIEELAGEPQFSVPPERLGVEGAAAETWWRDGVVPRRWERPGVLLVDEYNMGPHDVSAFLRPMLDNDKAIVVNDRRIQRDSFCFLGLAMNPAWAPQYAGTREISSADGSRVTNIFVNLPPESVERVIITRACEANTPPYNPPLDTVDRVMEIAKEIRALVDDGSLPIPWGVREQIKVLKLTAYVSLFDAYRMAIIDGMEPSTGELVMDVVKRYVS